jgi:NAD(P)-dependent dehydrogenase (short-subunit alcohol dehydrogenase family)
MTITSRPATGLRFDGQIAVITGATSGLGRGYALELARRGATVVGTSHRRNAAVPDEVAVLTAQASAEGLDLHIVPADMTVEAEATALVLDTISGYGRVDILVNNAGAAWVAPIQEGSTEQLRAMLDVHLMGTFWTMLPALAHMRQRGMGRIVNTVSGVGLFGRAGTFAYAAAKGAVQALNRCAALDNADVDGIRINAITPIAVTPMSGEFQTIHPELDADRMSVTRVLPALVYLAHESCRLNGQVLHAAGGRVALAGTFVTRGWGSDTLTAEDVARHIDQICDLTDVLVLQGALEQYDYIPKRPADFAAWSAASAR